MSDDDRFDYRADPDHQGWMIWALRDETLFNALLGRLRVRREGAATARVRMQPERRHGNLAEAVHGGAQVAFIDVALFAAARSFGVERVGGAVTLDLSTQFIAPGRMDEPLDAVIDLLRETGRLVFLRGLLVQDEATIASFTGTIRKGPVPR